MRLRLHVPEAKRRRAGLELARALSVPVPIAVELSAKPELLLALDDAAAQTLLEALRALGANATAAPGGGNACPSHPALGTLDRCSNCGAPVCLACELSHRARLCVSCFTARKRRARNRNVRVAVLLMVLVAVALYGWQRTRRRALRNSWNGPLPVAVVLVAPKSPSPEVVAAWTRGLSRLETWMQGEYTRANGSPGVTMLPFTLLGPVTVDQPLPLPQPDAEVAERTRSALAFESAASAIDEQASVPKGAVVIDVWLEPAGGSSFVEGLGEAGGVRGLVHGNLDDTQIDLELIAVAHELLHCLGASDKYGADGHALPNGLAEPSRAPLYPQRFAELMAVERATSAHDGLLPNSLDEVRVGPVTAREIGWHALEVESGPGR